MKNIIKIVVAILVVIILSIIIKNIVSKKQIDYEISSIDTYKYVKYRENEKYGIIDRDGNVIINARYDKIEIPNPEKDVFICYENETSNVYNSNNERIFEDFNKVEPIRIKNIASTLCFEKTTLKYEKDGKFGLVNIDGKKITANNYDSIENLVSTEGKLLVSKNQKYGVVNINGKKLVDTKYDKIATDNYYNDKTKYVKAGFIVSNTTDDGYKYGYISYDGKKLLDLDYNNIIRINMESPIYLIAAKNGKYGLYNEGKEIVKPEYQSINYLDNGGIIFDKNSQYGILNLKGEIRVQPKYSNIEEKGIYLYASNFSENSVYDVEGNKIDINYNKTIYQTENSNYKITTILNNDIQYYGIENSQGELLVKEKYAYIEYAFGEYFIAQNSKDKYGVIKANGNVVLDFKYDLLQKIKNKNVMQSLINKNNKIEIYSSDLELVLTMKDARIDNEKNYIKISNDKESFFVDKDGNKINQDSELVQNDLKKELPSKIKELTKKQYTLDDVYYEKER